MALTQSEERAQKISPSLDADIKHMVRLFKQGGIFAPGTKGPSFITRSLYKKNTAGIIETVKWKVFYTRPVDEALSKVLRCDRISETQEYAGIIEGTTSKWPIDRLETELKKKITKCLRNAWCEKEEDALKTSATTLKKPMLLHKWEKQKGKIKYPCAVQPKIDGVRAIYDKGKLYSRSGKVIDLPHITMPINTRIQTSFDCEIAFDDLSVPLPEIIHAISAKDKNLKLHIFDTLYNSELSFQKRHCSKVGHYLSPGGLGTLDCVRIVNIMICDDPSEVESLYTEAISMGMEGIVVRNFEAPYQWGKRSYGVLKYKFEIEDKFRIKGYTEVSHPEGNLIMFICWTAAHEKFEVVPAWKHSERRAALDAFKAIFKDDSYIGDMPEILVEYRGLTEDGKPYHAVGKTPWRIIEKGIFGKK